MQVDRLGLHSREKGEKAVTVPYTGWHRCAMAELAAIPRHVGSADLGVVAEVDRQSMLRVQEPPLGRPSLREQADERRVGPVRCKCNSRGCGVREWWWVGVGGAGDGVPSAVVKVTVATGCEALGRLYDRRGTAVLVLFVANTAVCEPKDWGRAGRSVGRSARGLP